MPITNLYTGSKACWDAPTKYHIHVFYHWQFCALKVKSLLEPVQIAKFHTTLARKDPRATSCSYLVSAFYPSLSHAKACLPLISPSHGYDSYHIILSNQRSDFHRAQLCALQHCCVGYLHHCGWVSSHHRLILCRWVEPWLHPHPMHQATWRSQSREESNPEPALLVARLLPPPE